MTPDDALAPIARLINDRAAGRPLTPDETAAADRLIAALRPAVAALDALARALSGVDVQALARALSERG